VIVGGYLAIHGLRQEHRAVSSTKPKVTPSPEATRNPAEVNPSGNALTCGLQTGKKLAISYPLPGTKVSYTAQLRGTAPFSCGRVYVVITTPTGSFVQDEWLNVDADGSWNGRATLGNGVNSSQLFVLRVFSTTTELSAPPRGIPADALISSPMTVIRE